uniref:Uncharacterized protein n=1 Tax=Acrobeloides nanus TaxID=290746 RepID=A0A914EPE7_9BILA
MGNKASHSSSVEHSLKQESRYNKEHTGGRFGHDHDRNQGAVRLGEEIKVENYNDHEGGIHERKHDEKHIEAHGIWGGPYTMHM